MHHFTIHQWPMRYGSVHLLLLIFCVSVHASENTPAEGAAIELNLSAICETPESRDTDFCQDFLRLAADKAGWNFRISYGFTRTHYYPTDVEIQSTLVNTTLRGFQFDERTSAGYYNPKNWTSLREGLKVFDEPTYRITVIAQKGKNVFHFILFHPKTLGAVYEKKEVINGQETVTYTPATIHLSDGTPEAFAAIPEGQSGLELQNTHQFITLQLGYGREFPLIRGRKSKLAYTPSVDAGLTLGAFRSIYISTDDQFNENIEKYGVQGFTVSAGHRLEFQRGRVFVALEHRFNYGEQENQFLDGTAKYNLKFQTVGLSLGVDLSDLGGRKKRTKRVRR